MIWSSNYASFFRIVYRLFLNHVFRYFSKIVRLHGSPTESWQINDWWTLATVAFSEWDGVRGSHDSPVTSLQSKGNSSTRIILWFIAIYSTPSISSFRLLLWISTNKNASIKQVVLPFPHNCSPLHRLHGLLWISISSFRCYHGCPSCGCQGRRTPRGGAEAGNVAKAAMDEPWERQRLKEASRQPDYATSFWSLWIARVTLPFYQLVLGGF